jgi:hypothetical protein
MFEQVGPGDDGLAEFEDQTSAGLALDIADLHLASGDLDEAWRWASPYWYLAPARPHPGGNSPWPRRRPAVMRTASASAAHDPTSLPTTKSACAT